MSLSVGMWVVVKYDGVKFPGEVTEINDDDVEVSVMHKSGKNWKWPSPVDKILYRKQDVADIISPPKLLVLVGSLHLLVLFELDYSAVTFSIL